MVYTYKTYVKGSQCDPEVKLSVIAVFELIEDSLTELLGSMSIDGVTAMKKYGAMWVFSKNTVRILRRPDWLEKFEVRSFISKHSPLRIFLDTEAVDENGGRLFASRVELCALDLETGRIRRPDTLGFRPEMEDPQPLEGLDFFRFSKVQPVKLESVTVRTMNLDYCCHTNNVEYVRFILNTYPAQHFKEHSISSIEMHYLGQSFEGDTLDIEKLPSEGAEQYFITRSGKNIASCSIVWEPRQE